MFDASYIDNAGRLTGQKQRKISQPASALTQHVSEATQRASTRCRLRIYTCAVRDGSPVCSASTHRRHAVNSRPLSLVRHVLCNRSRARASRVCATTRNASATHALPWTSHYDFWAWLLPLIGAGIHVSAITCVYCIFHAWNGVFVVSVVRQTGCRLYRFYIRQHLRGISMTKPTP
jgi:hypothetical protein